MVAVTLMWSTAGVVTRHLEHAQKFEVTFWRSLFTMLCLLVMLPLFKGRAVFGRMRHAGSALWLSGLCWCGMMTFFMVAIMLTTVANVLVTMALSPLLTALAARIFIGHRISLRTWLAIVVAGSGIAYMYASQLGQGVSLAGTLVSLCVPIAGAANWTITQHAHAQGKDIDLIPAVLVGAALSALSRCRWPGRSRPRPTICRCCLVWGWASWRFPAFWWWCVRGYSRRPKWRCWACSKSFLASCWSGWVPVKCRRPMCCLAARW